MPVSPRQHAKEVRGYEDDYLTCRDLRHLWRVVGYYRSPGGLIQRLLDCERCGTQREDRWRASGERENPRYSYVDGYQMKDGLDTWEVRKEVISRATVHKDQAAMIAAVTQASGTPKVRRGK